MNQGSLNGSLNMHMILKHWGEVENKGYFLQRLGRTDVYVKWSFCDAGDREEMI